MAIITITTAAAQDVRLDPTYRAKLGLSASATSVQVLAAVKAYLIQKLREDVQVYERDAAARAAGSAAFDPS